MQLNLQGNIQKSPVEIIYTMLVAMLPFFSMYASGIPGFTAADVLLAVCAVTAVLQQNRPCRNQFAVKPYSIAAALVLIVLFTVISFVTQEAPDYVSSAIRMIRYFFYMAVIVICSRKLLNLELLKKAIIIISLIATVYIIIQLIAYHVFDKLIMGFIPFFRLYTEQYATMDYQAFYDKVFYRPMSIFLEPAHYCRYVTIGLIFLLLDGSRINLKRFAGAAFISLGIMISTSTQGYAIMGLTWCIWLFLQIKNAESRKLKIFVIAMIPVVILILLNLPFVQDTIIRTFSGGLTDEDSALGGRLGDILLYVDLDLLHQMIGMGFGSVPEGAWFASAVYWLYGSGAIVTAIYVIFGGYCVYRLKGAARYILLVFLVLFFTDDCFYNSISIIFISASMLVPVRTEVKQN